jgi:hypothetical protein
MVRLRVAYSLTVNRCSNGFRFTLNHSAFTKRGPHALAGRKSTLDIMRESDFANPPNASEPTPQPRASFSRFPPFIRPSTASRDHCVGAGSWRVTSRNMSYRLGRGDTATELLTAFLALASFEHTYTEIRIWVYATERGSKA